MRTILCALVTLAFVAGTALTAEKAKKGTVQAGKIKKVDAEKGIVTVTVISKKDKEGKDLEFKIADDTKISILDGDDKKELTGKDGLKNEKFKEGAQVMVTTGEDKKVIAIRLGAGKKKDK